VAAVYNCNKHILLLLLLLSVSAFVCQVCPVCAAYPGGEPNHVIDDLAAHLMLEHRTSNNDLISLYTLGSASFGRWSTEI